MPGVVVVAEHAPNFGQSTHEHILLPLSLVSAPPIHILSQESQLEIPNPKLQHVSPYLPY